MSEPASKRLLRDDARTRRVAVHETVTLSIHSAEALLRTLRAGETVLALYHQGMGYAALTDHALLLLGGDPAVRVPKPLTILRPAHGARQAVDVWADGRSVSLRGSRFDPSGELLVKAGGRAPDPLAMDARTAGVADRESVSIPADHKQALLDELDADESVRSLYRDGFGHAALTEKGLVLLGGAVAPKMTRAPKPLRILRGSHGLLDSVLVLVDGKPHKLHGSKTDPKGAFLEAEGELLAPDSPLRPRGRTRWSAWMRRRPVLTFLIASGLLGAGLGAGLGGAEKPIDDAAGHTVAVPDFDGAYLTAAAKESRLQPWGSVTVADASAAARPVAATAPGWQVCFQTPTRGKNVRPSGTKLTLYVVPALEKCPTRLHGPRRIVMPDLVGARFDHATRSLRELGLDSTAPFHAYTGKSLDEEMRNPSEWQVCRQTPVPDTTVSTATRVDLWLIGSGAPCDEPSPTPSPTRKPNPKPKPEPRPEPTYGTTSGGGSTGGGSTGGGTGGGSGGGTGGEPGVQFGQHCSPVGSIATTTDGRPAKCFMGKDGRPRWGYNSN
ncbi:hypothetical protein [Streptomyces fructofermentans]|uniref:hypothetical protein n=1 Tax=Streptomyces fructofermentans TaxID=152141 RepID=UPI0037A55C0A